MPAIAALGGMVVPALIYSPSTRAATGRRVGHPDGHRHRHGGRRAQPARGRVVPSLKLFLLALAIVDDIGAILVIAVFYTDDSRSRCAALAVAVVVVVVPAARGPAPLAVYVVLGVGLWLALHESGLHATLAGVILGLMAPTRPIRQRVGRRSSTDVGGGRDDGHRRESVSVVEWLEHMLHPWTSFVIVPLFALANAGLPISADALSDAATSPITYGVVAGLVVGKLVGITTFTWLATRLRHRCPPRGRDVAWHRRHRGLAGIGFTVSIFVTGLAFDDVALQDEAKIGILAASLVAAMLGAAVLTVRRR